MAAILLIKPSVVNEKIVDNAREKFQKKSYKLEEDKFIMGEYELYYYHDLIGDVKKVFLNGQGDMFFMIGTLVFENKTGMDALKSIERSLNKGNRIENMVFSGSYILIVYRRGELLISRDLFGGIDCYSNPTRTWLTTNFLSAIALNENNKFSKNELLESILFGFVFGFHTIIEDIYLLETTKIFNLSTNSSIDKKIDIPPIEANHDKCLQNNLDVLIEEFEGYAKAFDGKIVSALSGGFDTRLMLALMLKVDVIPNLYVYGSDSAKDVRVAENIADGEGFSLMHIDKQKYPTVLINDFKKVVECNYYDLDLHSDVFANQSDLDTRKIRAQNGGLLLNGSGGEVYRDVWKWDFKETDLYNIFRNSYDIGNLEEININTKDFFENIEKKMRKKLSLFFDLGKAITRQEAEMIFPIYRAKFYSPSNTLNNYFGSGTFPFMSEPVLLQSFSIPHKFKRYGEFERILIKKLNPKLASYMSDYGFDFATGPGFKNKAMERIYAMLSPKAKTKIKSITSLSQKSIFTAASNKNPYLEEEYLEQLINPVSMKMDSYIDNIHKIKNRNILNRIYNYEYLANSQDIT